MIAHVSYCKKLNCHITADLDCQQRDVCTGCTDCPHLTRFVSPDSIEGFDRLDESQKAVFGKFLLNFYNRWGAETRKTIQPVSVRPAYETYSYMRFDYFIDENPEWLHVLDENTWF